MASTRISQRLILDNGLVIGPKAATDPPAPPGATLIYSDGGKLATRDAAGTVKALPAVREDPSGAVIVDADTPPPPPLMTVNVFPATLPSPHAILGTEPYHLLIYEGPRTDTLDVFLPDLATVPVGRVYRFSSCCAGGGSQRIFIYPADGTGQTISGNNRFVINRLFEVCSLVAATPTAWFLFSEENGSAP